MAVVRPLPNAVRAHVAGWLLNERRYAEGKLDDAWEDEQTPEAMRDFVGMYLHRATVLGLDTPAGKQAWMKALMTCTRFAESIVRRYGPPPMGGHPSGEIVPGPEEVPPLRGHW